MDPKGCVLLLTKKKVPFMRKILTKTKDSHIHDKIMG